MRFRVIEDPRAATLLPIIREWVDQESVVVSDGRCACIGLNENGFHHKVVIHENEFISEEGWPTQSIERKWLEGKAFTRRAWGGGPLLQSHVDEISWRLLHKNSEEGLLAAFLRDVKQYYTTTMEEVVRYRVLK